MELPITDIKGKGSEGMEKGVSGILGMDFFARFDVRLDFQSGKQEKKYGSVDEYCGQNCAAVHRP